MLSYISLPIYLKLIYLKIYRWQFEIKTVSRRGVLLYNTGLTSRSDFVGVELVDGHLRLLLNKGNGAIELRSQWSVSDGKWHEVVIQFNPTFMEISVDGAAVSQRLPQGGSRYLDLAETVFVGGIELNKRSRALGQGLLSADTSFKVIHYITIIALALAYFHRNSPRGLPGLTSPSDRQINIKST